MDGQGTTGVRPFTIAADTVVTMQDMSITGGNSSSGGGIENSGTLTLLNSTVRDNHADSAGGGIDNRGWLSLINSTVSHNEASDESTTGSGGGINNSGTVGVVNSTISDNEALNIGGGINNAGGSMLVLHNSIVANNSAGNEFDCYNTGTASAQNSLVESDYLCLAGGTDNVSADPNLGPLQDNGGPTWTHALLANSPAINAGDNALAVIGQRATGV